MIEVVDITVCRVALLSDGRLIELLMLLSVV